MDNIKSKQLLLGKESVFVKKISNNSLTEFLKPDKVPEGCKEITVGGNKNPALIMYGKVEGFNLPNANSIWHVDRFKEFNGNFICQYDPNLDVTLLGCLKIVEAYKED